METPELPPATFFGLRQWSCTKDTKMCMRNGHETPYFVRTFFGCSNLYGFAFQEDLVTVISSRIPTYLPCPRTKAWKLLRLAWHHSAIHLPRSQFFHECLKQRRNRAGLAARSFWPTFISSWVSDAAKLLSSLKFWNTLHFFELARGCPQVERSKLSESSMISHAMFEYQRVPQ